MIEVITPSSNNAAVNPNAAQHPTARDLHIVEIESKGRMAWQTSSGYNQRFRIEKKMGRWKTVISPKLKAQLRKSEDRGQDWRPDSELDD
jgi:hypothetical protein